MTDAQTAAETLCDRVADALDDIKAVDPRILDVRGQTAITDFMAFATGNSRRHARAIAETVIEASRGAGQPPLGVEGMDDSEWILVDLGDLVLHVMLEDVRDFYRLERIWGVEQAGG